MPPTLSLPLLTCLLKTPFPRPKYPMSSYMLFYLARREEYLNARPGISTVVSSYGSVLRNWQYVYPSKHLLFSACSSCACMVILVIEEWWRWIMNNRYISGHNPTVGWCAIQPHQWPMPRLATECANPFSRRSLALYIWGTWWKWFSSLCEKSGVTKSCKPYHVLMPHMCTHTYYHHRRRRSVAILVVSEIPTAPSRILWSPWAYNILLILSGTNFPIRNRGVKY